MFKLMMLGWMLTETVYAAEWLKGDFHVHSHHSTDASDSSVANILAKAESLQMDFLVITDHDNHVEGKITTWDDPEYRSSRMVLLYGAEWTTGAGHANLMGAKPFDYGPYWELRDTDIPRTLELAHAEGLHFSVNHPAAKDNWVPGFAGVDVDSTEVWTAVFTLPDNNRKAIQMWDAELMSGRRLAARGGSDSHHQKDFESQLFNIGNPTTWVFAERDGEGILAALKEGRVSLGYAATAERVEFYADDVGIGGNVISAGMRNVHFRVVIAGARAGASYDVDVVRNGKVWKNVSTKTGVVEFDAEVTGMERSYFRVEVKGATPDAPWLSALAFGRFVGMTNPIYFNY